MGSCRAAATETAVMFIKSLAVFFLSAFFVSQAYSASITLSPNYQAVDGPFSVQVSAHELTDVVGLNIEIEWDSRIMECTSFGFDGDAFPDFREFVHAIDSGSGTLETLLLRLTPGGFTGDAEAFITMNFQPVYNGTYLIVIRKTWLEGDPILVDSAGNSIEAVTDTATVFVEGMKALVSAARLHQNYPNPFNPGTTICFEVPDESSVSMRIYNVRGQLVRVLIDNVAYRPGTWSKTWDGTDERGASVPSGVYFCVLETAGVTASNKLVIIR